MSSRPIFSILVAALTVVFAAALLAAGCLPGDEAGTPSNQQQNETDNNETTGECVELTPRWSATTDPSAVSLHMTARDCETGQPLGYPDSTEWEITEDGNPVPHVAADVRQLTTSSIRPYVLLVVDVADISDEELREAARDFVDELEVDEPGSDVHLGIAPGGDFDEGQRPVADIDRLDDYIDEMSGVDEADARTSLEAANDAFRQHLTIVAQRNDDGVVPSGHTVVLTDDASADETEAFADRVAADRVEDREAGPGIDGWSVAVGDQVRGDLAEVFGGDRWVRQTDDAAQGLSALSSDIDSELNGGPLLSYCSDLRSDGATVEVSLEGYEGEPAEFSIDAGDFEDGCSMQALEAACSDRECGGLHCGGCLDTRDICGGADGDECIHYCLDQVVCTDETVTNDLGHRQGCHMGGDEILACGGQCVDTHYDDDHCGECDNACTAPGAECELGHCRCDGGEFDCGGECVDLEADDDHCGACDHACPEDVDCVDGQCLCDDGTIACDGTCVDTADHDDHCGSCGNDCGDNQQCQDGFCACDDDLSMCGDDCVDIFTDDDHCGACGNVCEGDELTCDNATCVCEADGQALCDGDCIEVTGNDDHCGGCDITCGDDQTCSDGDCVCDDDALINCDGECVDTTDHDDYCGGCDNACGDDEICEDASCQLAPILDDKMLRAGDSHTCALELDGSAVCWGLDDNGQSDPSSLQFSAISPGDSHTCGVDTSETAFCWGLQYSGEADVPSGLDIIDVAAGWGHTCAIEADGSAVCWGADGNGESSPPAGDFEEIGVGWDHSCGLETDGDVSCWGDADDGKTDAPGGDFQQLAVGMNHACAVDTDDEIQCWGQGGSDQTDAPGGEFQAVAAGGAHSCAIETGGDVTCWGSNTNDQVGDAPTGEFQAVAAGFQHSCAIETDGDVTCWGADEEGQATFPGW